MGQFDFTKLIKDTTYSMYLEYDSSNNPVYIGEAIPGSSTSDSVWRIKKLTADGSNNITSILWAEGTATFNKIWDNRTSYSYS